MALRVLLTLGFSVWTLLHLRQRGRPVISPGMGKVYLATNAVFHPESAQHVLDLYSIQHAQHGILNYLALASLLGTSAAVSIICLSMVIACVWELLENTDGMISKFQDGSSTLYTGDTVVNSMSDILVCVLATGAAVSIVASTKVAVATLVAFELAAVYIGRDSLLLSTYALVATKGATTDYVREWQHDSSQPVWFWGQLYPIV